MLCIARTMLSQDVRLSVCLSHAVIETAKHIRNLLPNTIIQIMLFAIFVACNCTQRLLCVCVCVCCLLFINLYFSFCRYHSWWIKMFILSNCFHRHHSSFSYQTVWQYSNRNFPNRGAEYIHLYSPNAGIIKNATFCQYLASSRKWCKIEL